MVKRFFPWKARFPWHTTCRDSSIQFPSLVEAGDNCHQVAKSFRILTEKEAFLDLWIQALDGRGARIERLNLPGLENAKSRRNRLEVSLWLEGDAAIVKIKDIGWGDLQPGTGLDWEFEIGLAQS